MLRKIVHIDEEKCNGCGLCVTGCHEGAIQLINGKAKLISDEYCDGLGDCLPQCPTGAIKIIERDAEEYNEELVLKKMEERKNKESLLGNSEDNNIHESQTENGHMPCGCPGTMAKIIQRKPLNALNLSADTKKIKTENLSNAKDSLNNPVNDLIRTSNDNNSNNNLQLTSELRQWPVQMRLVNTKAPYLENADLLIAADCTAYAYADFHRDFIKDKITLIGCPKLDDNNYYKEKLAEILTNNNINSIKVIRMSVPCCSGIVSAVKGAMLLSGVIVPYSEVIVDTDGSVLVSK